MLGTTSFRNIYKYPHLVKGQYLPAAECLGRKILEGGKTYTWGEAPEGGLDNDYVCSFDYTKSWLKTLERTLMHYFKL